MIYYIHSLDDYEKRYIKNKDGMFLKSLPQTFVDSEKTTGQMVNSPDFKV